MDRDGGQIFRAISVRKTRDRFHDPFAHIGSAVSSHERPAFCFFGIMAGDGRKERLTCLI